MISHQRYTRRTAPTHTSIAFLAGILSITISSIGFAQHEHDGGAEEVAAPKVFLDKSPRIVAYQLKRLSNEQLKRIETATDDVKYLPVFNAILSRVGMSPAAREEALRGLVTINKSNPVAELVNAMLLVKGDGQSARRVLDGLASLLLAQDTQTLSDGENDLQKLTSSSNPLLPRIGFAGTIASGNSDASWESATGEVEKIQWLEGIELVPNAELRKPLHNRVIQQLTSTSPLAVRRAAVSALASIPSHQDATFLAVSDWIDEPELKDEVVRTLLSVPPKQREAARSETLISWLVEYAENTPAAQRTETSFLDAMQLVDQLIAAAPSEIAKSSRNRLRETVVRVVRIHTVEEEMRYDIPFFAVEAGRPVQVVLVNEDLMPHNLVITTPGDLKEVADLGMQAGPDGGLDGKQYVPHSEKVLFATNMIAADATERLTFTAPTEPGEYPYVCTFPRHWMRMYGVMVVVDDLDAWNKNPVEPKDPIGSNRSFVQSWKIEDLQEELETGLRGRIPAIGEKLFIEATCAQCHKAGTLNIGNVGPELNTVFSRLKDDKKAVLREILDPSHRIEDKYAVHLILTVDGDTVSGLVTEETKDAVSILENPESSKPTVVVREDIEEMVKTANSMMPKGLLDRFSKDEIFEIMAYLQGIQTAQE